MSPLFPSKSLCRWLRFWKLIKMQATVSDIDENLNLIRGNMYTYQFHLLNSVSYLEDDRVRIICKEITQFVEITKFYCSYEHDYLSNTLSFVLRMCNFFIKDENAYLFNELFHLTIKIVEGIKRFSKENNCSKNIAIIIQLNWLLLKSGQIKFQVAGCTLLTKLIDMPFLKFSEVNALYQKAIKIFKSNNETSQLGCLIFAVINRKASIRNSKNDLSPSYLNLENECLNSLQEANNAEATEIIIRCLVLLYNFKQFDFSSEVNIVLPCLYNVCHLIKEPSCRKFVENFLTHLIVQKKCFQVTKAQLCQELRRLSDKYEEWPWTAGEVFFLVAYFFLMTSELLWKYQDILESVCSYVQHSRHISNDGLKSILMLYSSFVFYMEGLGVDQNIIRTGEIILNHLRACKNLNVILTLNSIPLTWIFKNADDPLSYKVLESWFQLEIDEIAISKIFGNIGMSHILINYFIISSNESMLLKASKVIMGLEKEKQLSQMIHMAILKVCSDVNKLGVFLRANFDVPEDPGVISKHLEILYIVLPLLSEEASITASCTYFKVLMDSFYKFGVNVKFDEVKLNLLIKFLICVCCSSDDCSATAAITLINKLLESKQLDMVVPLESPILLPFREVIRGSSKRINHGVELLHRILVQDSYFLITLNKDCLPDLYRYLFEIMSDETICAILKLLKVLSEMEPILYHSLIYSISKANKKNVIEEKNVRLLYTYFKFANRLQ